MAPRYCAEMTCYVMSSMVLVYTLVFVATFFWSPYNTALRACLKQSASMRPMHALCQKLDPQDRASIEHLQLCSSADAQAQVECEAEARNALGNSFTACQNGSCYKLIACLMGLLLLLVALGCVRMQADRGDYYSRMPVQRKDLSAADRDEYERSVLRLAAAMQPRASAHRRRTVAPAPRRTIAANDERAAADAPEPAAASFTGVTTVIDY
jgi:hypothetical protein